MPGRLFGKSDPTTPVLLPRTLQTLIFQYACSPAKGVVSVMAARVQIPASPLKPCEINARRVFVIFPVAPC